MIEREQPSRIAMQLAQKLQLQHPLFDEELIFHLLAGETLGAEGDLTGAAEEYGKAAKLSDRPEILSRAARISAQAESWAQLADIAARWSVLDPQSVPALQFAALAAAQQGAVGASVESLVKMIRLTEPQSVGWQSAAAMLADLPDGNTADAIIAQLIARDDLAADADGIYGQSIVAWQQGDMERARELAAQASASTERLEIIEWAGQLAHASGDTEAAIAHYQRALEIEPDDKALSLAYAELLHSNGQLIEAIEVLQGLDKSVESIYTEATYRLEAGEHERAAALLEELLAWEPEAAAASIPATADAEPRREEDPRLVHAFYTAQLADQLDNKGLAIDWYAQVDSGRFQAQATLRRAFLLAATGQLQEARKSLAATQQSDDEQRASNAYITEANLLQTHGDAAAAVALMTQALQRFPGNFELTYARALAAAANRDVELAEQDFRRLIRENPDNPVLLNALGYTLADLTDRYDEALSLIEAALELDDDDAATLDSMGWIQFKLGDLQQAEHYLQRAWEADDNPEIGAHLGEVLWLQDKQQAALEILRQAAGIDAQHKVLQETLHRLNIQLQ